MLVYLHFIICVYIHTYIGLLLYIIGFIYMINTETNLPMGDICSTFFTDGTNNKSHWRPWHETMRFLKVRSYFSLNLYPPIFL